MPKRAYNHLREAHYVKVRNNTQTLIIPESKGDKQRKWDKKTKGNRGREGEKKNRDSKSRGDKKGEDRKGATETRECRRQKPGRR